MTRLGISESAQYFDYNTTAHIERAGTLEREFPFEGLCGQPLYYCQDEVELLEERAEEHRVQKLCKRCMKRAEGTVRVAGGKGPMFGNMNLEIVHQGEWVHFGTIGNTNMNDNDWVDSYRKLCQEVLDRFLEGQKS